MIIFDSPRIREWDQYTIQNEPVKSIDLMERAAKACVHWLQGNGFAGKKFTFFCGKGNNGADGLAMARMLSHSGEDVTVHILEFGHKGTPEFQKNLVRLHATPAQITFISTEEALHPLSTDEVIIDALFGTGIHKPLEGLAAAVTVHINSFQNTVISIDTPSGMDPDHSSKGHPMVKATHTLSFQCLKLAFLVPENHPYVGHVQVLDIGLHPDFPRLIEPAYHFVEGSMIASLYKARDPFTHKGKQGHAALLVGAPGMMGAAILASRACLRSGVGKLTCFIPKEGLEILQVGVPEAICRIKDAEGSLSDLNEFSALGIGPGIGQEVPVRNLLIHMMSTCKGKLLLDADALNIIAADKKLLGKWPPLTVLTPHIGEWERLTGPSKNDFDRLEQVKNFARENHCIVVLKGRYTFIADPRGKCFFNGTGNSGLAKAGTGDVLTGMITSYLAQGYAPLEAALCGVYLHGHAADEAIKTINIDSLMASDVIDQLSRLDLPQINEP